MSGDLDGWLLGSGGGISTSRRSTCCALIRNDDHALLIDGGTGLWHLVAKPELIESVEVLDVVLTHFHLDHLAGLSYLPSVPLPAEVRMHGPGRALYGQSTHDLLRRVLTSPFLAAGWDLSAITSDIREIGEETLQLGPLRVTTRTQRLHSDPTLAVRVEDRVAYCTDTAYDPETIGFARGCDTLVHEAWATTERLGASRTHSSGAQAAEIAREAGVERLLLIHMDPFGDEEALTLEAQAVFPQTVAGTDLMPLFG